MGWSILGGVVGYVVTAVFIMVTFSGVYLAIGTERAFQPGSFSPSGLWIAASLILGVLAAIIGGWVSVRVGRGRQALAILIGLILVLGVVTALTSTPDPNAPTVRAGDLGNLEAMSKARAPGWMAYANIAVGVLGALIGGGKRRT